MTASQRRAQSPVLRYSASTVKLMEEKQSDPPPQRRESGAFMTAAAAANRLRLFPFFSHLTYLYCTLAGMRRVRRA